MKQIMISILVLLLWPGLFAQAFPLTPGYPNGSLCTVSNPDFVEYRYEENIPYCQRYVSTALKTKIYVAYGIPANCRHKYTIDHTIPLALGGSNHPQNLWPEHKAIKALRQNLELQLYYKISRGEITQAYAIQTILYAKNKPPLDHLELDSNDPCDRID